jgi:hypothetical protein
MISNIDKKIEKNILTVEITCNVKKFASNPTKILTTDQVLDMLKNEYKIKKTLKEPSFRVGNTQRRKVQQSGKWVFELEKASPARKKSSIRGRMSKIAQGKKEEELD